MFEFNPPTKNYGGYIFDCDGTLANSMPLHLLAWRAGIKASGSPFLLSPEEFMKAAGMSILQTIEHWNKEHQLTLDPTIVVEVKNHYFSSHRNKIKAIPPILDFAKVCKEKGLPISVASGGGSEDVFDTLKHIGAADLFDIVVTADDVIHSKPAPDLFLLAAQRMGIDPKDCFVLEDGILGIQAAEAAGMDSILLPHLLNE